MDLMKHKEDQWQELKTDAQKALVIGKLEAFKDVVDYFNSMRESLTRLLLVNDVKEEDYEGLKKNLKVVRRRKPTKRRLKRFLKR